jgi:hypothetical protein
MALNKGITNANKKMVTSYNAACATLAVGIREQL